MSDAQTIKDAAYAYVNLIAEYAFKANKDVTLVEIGGLAHSSVANVIRRESQKIYELAKDRSDEQSSSGTAGQP